MAVCTDLKRPEILRVGYARNILAQSESAFSDPLLAVMVRDQIRYIKDERDRLASNFHQVSESHRQESSPMPKILDAFLMKIPDELLSLDGNIAEELRRARTLKDIDDAVFAAEQAQRIINEYKKSRHPLGQCIATIRQAELDAILNAPWAPGVLFKGSALCLKNNPGDPYDGYQPTEGERAEIPGLIPTENRKGERLPRRSRHLPGFTTLQFHH